MTEGFVVIERRPMTWEESIQWVMKHTDVEWENLYIVEELYKDTTPKTVITRSNGIEQIISYE
jgi:hypothetical protein